jgi:hypothetical protein
MSISDELVAPAVSYGDAARVKDNGGWLAIACCAIAVIMLLCLGVYAARHQPPFPVTQAVPV